MFTLHREEEDMGYFEVFFWFRGDEPGTET
jgi:hypothetical protein